MKARVRIPRGIAYKSQLERDWALVLEQMKRERQILKYDYEAVRLRLADGAWYTPDFRIIWHDSEESYDEVKGHRREAAIVRLKVAAEFHPYRFRLVAKGERGEPAWKIEEVGP